MANILIKSFNDTINLIIRFKHIILIIFLIQIIFLFLVGINIITTMTPALSATKEVLLYVNQLRLDDAALAENILTGKSVLGDDPLLVQRNYEVVMKFIKLFVSFSFILFVIFEGFNWALTHHMIKKKTFKHFVSHMIHFCIVSIVYFTAMGLILYGQLNSLVDNPQLGPRLVLSITLVMILSYFMLVSYGLLHNKNLLIIIKKTVIIGFYKAYILIPVVIASVILILLVSLLLFKTAESYLIFTILSIILVTSTFIFTRLYFVKLINEMEN
ncbi:MAG: hypothetical protein ABIC04_03455 [Nanoarchaeota archaeon]